MNEKTAEEMKFDEFYASWEVDDGEEAEELCHITGDLCIGDPMFCEECPIILGEDDE